MKKTKLFSWAVASVAALTMLCSTQTSAAQLPSGFPISEPGSSDGRGPVVVSLFSGADGFYLRNSDELYTFQVGVPKNHFVAIRLDGIYLMGEKAPEQIAIKIGGTAPAVIPEETGEAAETSAPVEIPATPGETPATPDETPASGETPAPSEVRLELPYRKNVVWELINLLTPIEASAETYYTTIGIPASYLDTLSDGSHTVVMDFVEGSVTTTITVTSDASMLTNDSPSTGDTTHVLPYVLLAAGSACVLVFLAKKEKKETR